MSITILKGYIEGFLSSMPEPLRSMSIETEDDRERLALALHEYQRPMPPNASEMEK
jgi:hypothetical protein